PKIVKLGIAAARQELNPAETLTLTLRGQFSDGSENEITKGVQWSSSDPRVAAVSTAGKVAAKQPGSTEITATYAGITSSSWTLAVKAPDVKPPPAPKLVAITVDANKKTLAPREKIDLRATGSYSDGSKKNLSSGVAWVSSDASVASVDSKGELEALQAGKVEIMIRLDGVTSAPLRLVVKEPPRRIAAEPERPKRLDYVTTKTPTEATVPKETRRPVPQITAEQLRTKIANYIDRAKDFRVQGNYGAALAELATARASDPESAEVRSEIEQTKRACLAEKILGRKGLECG
ncbi:MAG: Ig-like domain-containing protein, partial [Deltaproteobacteria bacterium]|nr:Ig-like domain-containing protein [Deltaproteobacteria bacterium]